ncbi:MAG: PQQ-dependent sugar dehydrogenase [Planctomycetes bacterium]|nr:PQQ-dependent sugar dehydrogenase [Planctomycetota bacterium]
MIRRVHAACLMLSTFAALGWQAACAPAASFPEGFEDEVIATGLTGATAMAAAPDGRIFVCEQTGALRAVKDGRLLGAPFLTLEVDSSWERGLIGIALDPRFPAEPHVFVVYVAPRPYPHHRVSRFTASGDGATPGSEVLLLEGDDQRSLGGSVPAGHQGGGIRFGLDGCLYIGIGEQTAGFPSQKLDTFQGKLLRIRPDGSIPPDNPFLEKASGKYRAVWAIGLRNPFALAVDSATGRIFVNDVGGAAWEEVDEAAAGANYGWPEAEGPSPRRDLRQPVHAYERSVGKSITGGAFYRPAARQFPERYVGKYFFADFEGNWIHVLDPDDPRRAETFATGLARPVDLQVAADGSLLCLERNAWVKDEAFRPRTGLLRRIRFTGKARPRPEAAEAALPSRRGPSSPQAPAPPLAIAPAAGAYTGLVTVRITGSLVTAGVPVRYTADGSEPGDASQLYRKPFELRRSAVVRASAARPGEEARGAVVEASFTIAGGTPYGLAFREDLTGLNVPFEPEGLPRRLSETGVFRSVASLSPSPGVVPYDVAVPFWSDGAHKRRWIALPGAERIGFEERGEWRFPAGTVFVKHFEMQVEGSDPAARKRLETRLLVVGEGGSGYGVTYRWRDDGSDADLLEDAALAEVPVATSGGPRTRTWYYPSPKDCLTCHTEIAGFVLGVKTRQINRPFRYGRAEDNQLRTWGYLGMLDPRPREEAIASFDRLAALSDVSAPLERRVRSYLDANCAGCHRPAGTKALLDLRFDTPPRLGNLLNGSLLAGDLGAPGARVVVPGDPSRSALYLRMARLDAFKMPPIAMDEIDSGAVEAVGAWITSLKRP